MKQSYSVILIGLLLAGLAYLFLENRALAERNRFLEQQLSAGKGQSERSDPYMAGPIKNGILKQGLTIKKCYRQHTAGNPGVRAGQVLIDWQIDTDGSVLEAAVVRSPFQSEQFHGCLTAAIETWRFPEPPIKKYVSHTFRFTDRQKPPPAP